MILRGVELLNVFLKYQGGNSLEKYKVGRLALKNQQIYFEYDRRFLDLGIQISPFMLPLKSSAISCRDRIFDGLFGVFNDSLPDGWGRLLLDRRVEAYGVNRRQLSALDRLAHVGNSGMGALCYEPVLSNYKEYYDDIQLDILAEESELVLNGEYEEVFEELLMLNGSSAGARPKIVVGVSSDKKRIIHGLHDLADDFSHWMIKFPASTDPKDIGAIEYAYSLMAKEAGIEMPETYLFKYNLKNQYFGIKRFDRKGNQAIHMHSLCGLIHADHRVPSLDYEMVLKVTQALTKNVVDVEKVFRLACFNVLAHNRDDHSKNFSYILNQNNEWQFAPAYDLTFSYGPGGEQSTMVMGEAKNADSSHLLLLGKQFGLKRTQEIITQVQEAVLNWRETAEQVAVSNQLIDEIWQKLKA